MKLEQVVPFGRSLDEYSKMFNLQASDLQKSILGIADGPASFNAEGTRLGYRIKSVDPLYQFTAEQIQQRFNAVVDDIIEQIRNSPADWVWGYHGSPDGLKANRQKVIEIFCEDYELSRASQRYEIGELPHLKYRDQEYELGLCSHFLFLYSDHFDQEFHLQSILEMLRVCQEVRIFPLLTLMRQPSPHLEPIMATLQDAGFICEIRLVEYELQRGGNQMLKIAKGLP